MSEVGRKAGSQGHSLLEEKGATYFQGYIGGRERPPQDMIQHLDFTKDPRSLYHKTPPGVFYRKKKSVARPFSVLSKDEIGP